MSLKKQYSEANAKCKVTFKLTKEIAGSVNNAFLAGDFNGWDTESIPMKKLKNGEFSTSVNLDKGKEYQFKYLIDGKKWINEQEADKHVPNEFQTENSVVII